MRTLIQVKGRKVVARWDNFPEGDPKPHDSLIEFLDSPASEIPRLDDFYNSESGVISRAPVLVLKPTAEELRRSDLLNRDPSDVSPAELVELVQLLAAVLGLK